MKTIVKKIGITLTALAMLASFAFGDVIALQNFDGGTPNWTYTADPVTYTTGTDDWAIVTTNSAPDGTDGDFWGIQDLDNPNGGTADEHVLTFGAVDMSGYATVTLSFRYYTKAFDAADYLKYEVYWGDAGLEISQGVVSLDKNTQAWTTISVNIPDGTESAYIKLIAKQNGSTDFAGADDFTISGTSASAVDAPTALTPTVVSKSQINLAWTENANGNEVLLVYDTDGTFDDPEDGTPYGESGAALGGTIVYKGNDEAFSHLALTANTQYFYKAWSVDGSNVYSSGITANATTLKDEPTNHVNTFAGTVTHNSATLTWVDNNGAVAAEGFMVKISTTSLAAIPAPADGTDEAEDEDLSDGAGVISVPSGDEELIIEGLDAETDYFFKIYPFTNSGDGIDFKLDATVPELTKTTTAAPATPVNGNLYISEICDENAGGYQTAFMEIYNTTSSTLLLTDTYIQRIDDDGVTVGYTYTFGTVYIPANGILIVSRGSDKASFESGWSVDLNSIGVGYDEGNNNLYFTTGRSYKLYNASDVLMDSSPSVDADKRIVHTSVIDDGSWSAMESSSNGTPGVIDETQTFNGPATPITLSSFSADVLAGAVELSWETASETNNAQFIVYRNGEAIATVDGAGTTSETNNYTLTDNAVKPGAVYTYVLADLSTANVENKYEAKAITVEMPTTESASAENFVIAAAYPNPFNPTAQLPITIMADAKVRIALYDLTGRQVAEIANETLTSGHYNYSINGANLSTGIYLLQTSIDNTLNVQKLLLSK